MRRLARLVFLLVLVSLPACGVHGLNFEQDKRVTISTPKDRSKVRLPLTVRWTFHDFRVTGRDGANRTDAGYFGIYVDRAPQPPLETQAWLLRNDTRCKFAHTCDTRTVLDEANIYSSTAPNFAIAVLPRPPTNAAKRREFHEMTIVLLNGKGQRIGESAFRLRFEVDRSGESS